MLPAHRLWLATQLGVILVNGSYASAASNNNGCTDLTSTAVISATDIYGVGMSCFYTDDVIQYNPSLPGAQNVSWYAPTGSGSGTVQYAASVWHRRQPLNDPLNYVSLVDGFDLADLWSRYCTTTYGQQAYTYNVMTKVFGQVCGVWASPCPLYYGCDGTPVSGDAAAIANFMKLGNSVVRSGSANVRFGVAATGRVRVRLYDLAGRVVRTLADRTYAGSQEYSVPWDGRDDTGRALARGVYFARIDYASGAAISGRIVMLR